MSKRTIYLDNAATTRLDPHVLEAMLPYLKECYGNPSSLHALGLEARRALEGARERCARLLGTEAGRIVFTPSGSASNNLLVKGLLKRLKNRCVITTKLEHPSVVESVKVLSRHGVPVLFLENDGTGKADLDHLRDLLQVERCGLLCVIHGSNEVGTLQDAGAIGNILREASPETWFHLDAVQSVGHVPVLPEALGIQSLTLSSHKLHGPRGAGLLVLYRDAELTPLVAGGGQEGGRLSGTENVPAIVGAAEALDRALRDLEKSSTHIRALRNLLAREIQAKVPESRINGDPYSGLPHILSVSFSSLLGEVLLHHLEEQGIMVSTGAACGSEKKDTSPTLRALGVPDRFLRGTLRFSLSRHTTAEEIAETADAVAKIVPFLREVGMR